MQICGAKHSVLKVLKQDVTETPRVRFSEKNFKSKNNLSRVKAIVAKVISGLNFIFGHNIFPETGPQMIVYKRQWLSRLVMGSTRNWGQTPTISRPGHLHKSSHLFTWFSGLVVVVVGGGGGGGGRGGGSAAVVVIVAVVVVTSSSNNSSSSSSCSSVNIIELPLKVWILQWILMVVSYNNNS